MPYRRSAPGDDPPLWSRAAIKPPFLDIWAVIWSLAMIITPVSRPSAGTRGRRIGFVFLAKRGARRENEPCEPAITASMPSIAYCVASVAPAPAPFPSQTMTPLDPAVLPPGIRARFVRDINGLDVHLLEAGFNQPGRPLVILLHGFPEIAYSWRKVMSALAEAGFHAVAPDLRGYGRTTGWSANYDDDLRPFRLLNCVRDILGLVAALGYREAAAVVGHDFGASVAAWCALVRPDVFRSLALMSAPFAGPPDLPFASDSAPGGEPPAPPASPTIHEALASLPRPRKHYQWYYSTRPANAQMWYCKQGVHAFRGAFSQKKSADWKETRPQEPAAGSAEERARMPPYNIMVLLDDMPAADEKEMLPPAEIAACR